MRILSMTATFGKLERETLRLEDGLNILHLPNEGGKSTWCAFLLAMLYGIDTAERVSRGMLPVKTKYKPWSGSPMEGRMELLWNGKHITVERGTRGRVPMGEFRAYETESGLPVAELTAENCGMLLLGVPKAVYERSAFLRQSGHRIGQHGALEQRLAALVTSGEETASYSETEQRLRERKNALRHHKTGELPRLEQQLEETEETLRRIRGLQNAVQEAQTEEETVASELLRLERLEQSERRGAEARYLQEKQAAEQKLQELRQQLAAEQQAEEKLPSEEELRNRQARWATLQQSRRTLPAPAEEQPRLPALHPALAGKTAAETEALMRQELSALDAYEKAAQPIGRPLPWAAMAAALVGAALLILRLWVAGAAVIALAAFLLALCGRNAAAAKREQRNARFGAEELLRRWQVPDRQALMQLFARALRQQADYAQEREQHGRRMEHYRQQLEMLNRQENDFLRELEALLPGSSTEPAMAIAAALDQRRQHSLLEREAAEAERYLTLLNAGYSRGEDTEETAAIRNRIRQTEERLRQVRSRLDHYRGQITALGDGAALESEKERLRQLIAEKEEQYAAVTMAMDALEAANHRLQTQYAPEISRRAAAILNRMTAGRYDRVLLDAELSASVRETGAVTGRETVFLSEGTADQLWLAVRLAICGAALPKAAPLVLDDALVNFDDERAAAAVELLREEGKERQILLFSCQKREKLF